MRFRIRRQWDDGKVEALARSREFGWMPSRELKAIAPYLGETTAPAGVILVTEGELNDRFFLLFAGTLEVTQGGRHKAFLSPGETFGSMRGEMATETVRTVTAVRLLVAGQDHYRASRHAVARRAGRRSMVAPTRALAPCPA